MKLQAPGAELLIRYLEREGVEYVFGIPGSPLGLLFDRLRDSKVKPVLVKHEAAAAFMADGYARFSGKIGVCVGTTGPGVTNLVTGVANAFADNVPILVLTGQVPTHAFARGGFQESTSATIDAPALLKPITKMSEMVIEPALLPRMLRKALRVAQTGRPGPVALNLPANVLSGAVDDDRWRDDPYASRVKNRTFDRKMVQRASRALLASRRPAILAGTGISFSGANEELVHLAELLSIPVATTPKAKGCFPCDHPLSLGTFGFAGHPRADRYIQQEADLILVAGSSLGQWATANFADSLERKTLLQLDIDPAEIGKNYSVEVGLVGDAQVILKELTYQLKRDLDKEPREARESPLEQTLQGVPRFVSEEKMFSAQSPLAPARVMRELREALPRQAIAFFDTGAHMIWGLHYFDAYEPRTFVLSSGLCTMGYAIAAAIGAKLAQRDRPTVCVTGDGCFLMQGMEVHTAVEYGVPVVWLIMDNGELGMVAQGQTAFFGRSSCATYTTRLDYARLARDLGAEGHRVDRPEMLARAVTAALASGRPTVIDVVIDPTEVPPAKTNANVSR